MSPTRKLILSATAFSLGLSLTTVLAEAQTAPADEQAQLQQQPFRQTVRPVRPAPRTPNVIRVLSDRPASAPATNPGTNNNPSTPPAPDNTGAGVETASLVAASNAEETLSGIPLPASERRPLFQRNTQRNGVRTPGTFVAVGSESGVVNLAWQDLSANETGFKIRRAKYEGNRWTAPETITVPANTTSYQDQVEVGVYAYSIAASGANGESWYSRWDAASVRQPNGNANGNTSLSTPVGLTAADTGDRRATLRWNAMSGVREFVIERDPAFTGGAVRVAGNTTQYIDLSGAGQFDYRIKAANNQGESTPTNWIGVNVAQTLAAAPTNLTTEDAGDRYYVRVNWTDNSDNEDFFVLSRETLINGAWGAPWSVNVARNNTYLPDSVGPGTHRYRVAAINAAGLSSATAWSQVTVAGATQPPTEVPPSAPQNLAASDAGGRAASLAWQDTSNNEQTFDIERNPAFAGGQVKVNANLATFVDTDAPAGTVQYRVRASNSAGASPFTPWADVLIAEEIPAPPSSFAAVDLGNNRDVRLSWGDASDNEAGFRVERQKQASGVWGATSVLNASANTTSLVDQPGPGPVRYRVASTNTAGVSAYSAWVNVTVPNPPVDPGATIPAAPTAAAANDNGGKVGLVWTDASTNETGFEIERNPAFASTVTLGANVSGYLDNSGAGTFAYRVRSFNGAGSSAWSNWANVIVAPPLPTGVTGLTLSDAGNQRDVTIRWTDNQSDEQGFRIERQTFTSNAWGNTTTRTVSPNTATFLDAPGLGQHRYRVQSYNASGDGAWTNYETITVTAGWTPIVKSPDTREIYVSSSQGNDNNDGLTPATAVKTLAKGYTLLRSGFPDHLRLRRGDTWTREVLGPTVGNWQKSGRSGTEPMVIHSYNEADPNRPKIVTQGVNWACLMMNGGGVNNVHMIGLDLNSGGGEVPGGGIRIYGQATNILFEDLNVSSFSTNFVFEKEQSITNVRIRRSTVVDAYSKSGGSHSQGIYAYGVDGLLIEDCVFDHNGWRSDGLYSGSYSTIYNHNMYFVTNSTNVNVRNTISSRASATGMQLRGRFANAYNVLSINNPLGLSGGHEMGAWPGEAWTGSISYSVVLGSNDIGLPNGPSQPRGMGVTWGRAKGARVNNNIIAHNTQTMGAEGGLFTDGTYGESATVEDNIVYNWKGRGTTPASAMLLRRQLLPGEVLRRNTFIQPNGGTIADIATASPGGSFSNNRYFSTSNPDTQWFKHAGQGWFNFASWVQRSGETGGQNTTTSFPDPNRGVATYMASLGMTPTVEAFLAEARKQSKTNWRNEFTAAAVNKHVRQGFGMAEPSASSN